MGIPGELTDPDPQEEARGLRPLGSARLLDAFHSHLPLCGEGATARRRLIDAIMGTVEAA